MVGAFAPGNVTLAQPLAIIMAAMVMCLGLIQPLSAQQPPPPAQTLPPAAAKPKKDSPPAAPKPAKVDAAPTGGQGEAALRQRVENLEEQLVDMQVVVGTLESLAKSSGASSASPAYRASGAAPDPGGSGVDQARVSGLEAQVRSLTSQLQSLTEQVRAQAGQARRSDAAPLPPAGSPSAFGKATVEAAPPDQIGTMLATTANRPDATPTPLPPVTAAVPAASPPGDGTNPKQLYETAYGHLLQQDYGAAEAAFDDFLKRYPSDRLAGSAQFWLGESHFVRGQFKPAASAFLKGYQTYGQSPKAPDSLLKLAMSLGRMGQKNAACSSFGELATRFPAASADVKSRAATEKQRTGCP